ncbi:hypothetical protein [Calidifontibacter indicus]|uniref:hypothetical protein n=1 Tax=Calidifontibacter indicus TaxID=419650 RepID=UPI003D750D84
MSAPDPSAVRTAGIQGVFAIVGGLVAGWLYDRSLTALAVVVAITQAVALVILVRVVAQVRRRTV